jgi:hypothetical protein
MEDAAPHNRSSKHFIEIKKQVLVIWSEFIFLNDQNSFGQSIILFGGLCGYGIF